MQTELVRSTISKLRESEQRAGHMRLYDARIANALGDVVAALLLERIVYFYCLGFQGHTPYTPVYLFQAPCQHNLYRKGESLTEALSIRKVCQLRAALKTIGTKLKCPSKKDMRDAVLSNTVAIFDSNGIMTNAHYLVTYETDARRVTRYSVNEELYFDMLQKLQNGVGEPVEALAPRVVKKPEFPEPTQKPVAPAVVTPAPVAPVAPVEMTREQEIEALLDKQGLDAIQKTQVKSVFAGYSKSKEVSNWKGLLISLCNKLKQGELSLPETPVAHAPKVEKAKPKGKRLDAALKDELMRELQSKATQSEWLMYMCGTQFVQVDNGLLVIVPNDLTVRFYKTKPELTQACEAVTGIKVVGVRVGSIGDYDCGC